MDLFPNGGFVRLRSRARDVEYVHADEDARGVSLRPLGATPSVNAVWKVEHRPVQGGGGNLVLLLLQGAAYGRYLSVTNLEAPRGHRGISVVQREYTLEYLLPSFVWTQQRAEAGQNYVRLHNDEQRVLRANGRYRFWNDFVTLDVRTESTMMQWSVEPIPSTPDPLPLPPPQPPRHGLFRRRIEHPGRRISIVRVDDDGNPVADAWPVFVSNDNSVSNLRTQVAQQPQLEDGENITLGVRAGMNARVIPLVTDLPNNEDSMQIIVFTTGSRAAAALRYPQF